MRSKHNSVNEIEMPGAKTQGGSDNKVAGLALQVAHAVTGQAAVHPSHPCEPTSPEGAWRTVLCRRPDPLCFINTKEEVSGHTQSCFESVLASFENLYFLNIIHR